MTMTTSTLVKKELAEIPLFDLGEAEHSPFVIKSRLIDNRLILQVYEAIKEEYVLRFRIFAVEGNYISQVFDISNHGVFHWSRASLLSLANVYLYYVEREIQTADKGSEDAILHFLKKEENAVVSFVKYQQSLIQRERFKRNDRIRTKVEERMHLVPDLPSDFDRFIDEKVLYSANHMYYTYENKKEVKGYCTHCKTSTKIARPKNGETGVCPVCGFGVTYKSRGRAKPIRVNSSAILMQSVGDEMLFRRFEVSRYEDGIEGDVRTSYTEKIRVFKSKGKEERYVYRSFKNQNFQAWQISTPSWNDYIRSGVLYAENIEDLLLRFPQYRYSAIKQLAMNSPDFAFDPMQYLDTYLKYPVMEYLVKAGLYRLVKGITLEDYRISSLNTQKRSLNEVLALNTENRKLLQKINGGFEELEILRRAQRRGVTLTEESVTYLLYTLFYAYFMIPILEITTFHKARRFIEEQTNAYSNNSDYVQSCYYRADRKTDRVRHQVAQDYRDYLDLCKELDKDLKNEFLLFPKDLQSAHEKAIQEVRSLRDEKRKKEKEANYKIIEEMQGPLDAAYHFEHANLLIRAPISAVEIIEEGEALHHCVESYIDRVAKKETVILFLRKKSEVKKPYVTVEVRDNKVIQYRGFSNKLPENIEEKKEIIKCMEAFKKEKLRV